LSGLVLFLVVFFRKYEKQSQNVTIWGLALHIYFSYFPTLTWSQTSSFRSYRIFETFAPFHLTNWPFGGQLGLNWVVVVVAAVVGLIIIGVVQGHVAHGSVGTH